MSASSARCASPANPADADGAGLGPAAAAALRPATPPRDGRAPAAAHDLSAVGSSGGCSSSSLLSTSPCGAHGRVAVCWAAHPPREVEQWAEAGQVGPGKRMMVYGIRHTAYDPRDE